MPKLTAIVLVLLLAGCQSAPVRDEDSPHSRVSVGSRFILQQGLTVPPGNTRIFLQQGVVVPKVQLQRYQPHCNFELRDLGRGESRIEPGSFLVTGVVDGDEQVVEGPLRLASLFGGGEGAVQLVRFVHHTLASAEQPGVMRLTCHGGFAEPWQADYPSIRVIREALGAQVTLELEGE